MWQQRGSALLCIMAPEGITAGRPVARASAFERTGGNGVVNAVQRHSGVRDRADHEIQERAQLRGWYVPR